MHMGRSLGLGLTVVLLGLVVAGPNFISAKSKNATSVELPTDSWTLHIDALKHFPGDPEMVAHHYCKGVSGGLTECLIFDSEAADARLVAIEMIVDPATYNSFDPEEQKLWHYHKTEIPIVEATLPDLSPEEAAEVVKAVEQTYGKVYLLWDPSQEEHPVGEPMVYIIGDPSAHAHPER